MKLGHSHTMKKDSRQPIWRKQKKQRGFDDTELWALDYTLAQFLVPRLKEFKKLPYGSTPQEREKWERILDQMIEGFSIILEDKPFYSGKEKKVTKAFKLLAKWYSALWY